MFKYVEFDEMLEKAYFLMPMIGLKDLFKNNSLKTVFLQRMKYAILMIILIYTLVSGTLIVIVAISNGVFMERFLEMVDVMGISMAGVLALLKSLNVFIKRREIGKLLNELKEMWPGNDADEDIIKCAIETARNPIRILKWYSITEMVIPLLFLLFPLVLMPYNLFKTGEMEFILPFYDEPFLNWRMSVWQYILSYAFQVFSAIFAVFNEPLTQCVLITSLANIALQFKLISMDLMKLAKNSSVNISEELLLLSIEEERRVNRELNDIIEKHKKLLRFSDKLQKMFGSVLAANFVFSGLIICLECIVITMGPFYDSPKHIIFVCAMMLKLFLPCWYSTVLSEESYGIVFGVYCSEWLRMSEGHKRSLRILQIRAQRAVTIRATAFFTVDVQSFITVLTSAWSYFALLQTIYNK